MCLSLLLLVDPMGVDLYLHTLQRRRGDYAAFIRTDHTKRQRQMECLLALRELQAAYVESVVSDASHAEWNSFSKKNSINWAFELFQMRKAVIAGRPHVFSGTPPSFTRQANEVLLLAMLYGHQQIVSFFISNKLIHVNQSIFGSRSWPSYFLLACICSAPVFEVFREQWVNADISWNGLSASILALLARNRLENSTQIDFLTYQQFVLLNRYRGVTLITGHAGNDNKTGRPVIVHPRLNLPIFLIDFACMISDRKLIREILDTVPEAGYLSRLSFVVQSEEHLILVLSRYGFRTDQQFDGNTPLHISCHNNDFCILSILLYIGFPIVRDRQGRFPNEIGSHKMREKTSIFFNICADVPTVQHPEGVLSRRFSRESFREHMTTWMHVLKYNPNEFDKYTGIFRYLDFNRDNRIMRKSRFNIINVFSSAKSPVSVERAVQNLMAHAFSLSTYTSSESLILYSRYFG
eukprot:Pompholyxophrys_punicea_v1_NODE_1_length_14747_cov_12.267901.p3 type:complete len:465 gc:universal NODE_1_length_14747_cov_12.267901:10911-9517(-)